MVGLVLISGTSTAGTPYQGCRARLVEGVTGHFWYIAVDGLRFANPPRELRHGELGNTLRHCALRASGLSKSPNDDTGDSAAHQSEMAQPPSGGKEDVEVAETRRRLTWNQAR
jgi:hypothetical protein